MSQLFGWTQIGTPKFDSLIESAFLICAIYKGNNSLVWASHPPLIIVCVYNTIYKTMSQFKTLRRGHVWSPVSECTTITNVVVFKIGGEYTC